MILYPSMSLSARRAWIEIGTWALKQIPLTVALRKESVDRNFLVFVQDYNACVVALRKESVDRNCDVSLNYKEVFVALRKESVDRNLRYDYLHSGLCRRSPQGERG